MKKHPIKHLLLLSFFIFSYLFSFQECKSQWAKDTNGIGIKYVYSLAHCGNYIFAGTIDNSTGGIYISSDNGINWVRSLNIEYVYSICVNGNNIFAGGSGVYLSTNNGSNWVQTSLIELVYSIGINGNNIFAGTYSSGVYLSTNNGLNWIQTSLNNTWVYAMAVSGIYSFAGTISSGVLLSTNNGTNWTNVLNTGHDILTLAIKGDTVYAGSSGFYISTNYGSNWFQGGLSNIWVIGLALYENYIFVGTTSSPSQGSFYVSSNNGLNWTQKNEGLSCTDLRSICILNNYIFIGTDTGVYKRPLYEIVGEKNISETVPKSFFLYQNYPNPFNPSTKIKFSIPQMESPLYGVPSGSRGAGGFITLKIYDILGREITTLVNENLQPGTYEAEWNASNYSSGVYFYKIMITNPELGSGSIKYFSQTKRMVLLK